MNFCRVKEEQIVLQLRDLVEKRGVQRGSWSSAGGFGRNGVITNEKNRMLRSSGLDLLSRTLAVITIVDAGVFDDLVRNGPLRRLLSEARKG